MKNGEEGRCSIAICIAIRGCKLALYHCAISRDQVAVIGDGIADDRRGGAARAVQGCVGDLFSRRRETASSGANHGNAEV